MKIRKLLALLAAERTARFERLTAAEDLEAVEAWRPALDRLYARP